MSLDKVKTLISENETQKAIDLLQDILLNKNVELLNKTYLLENQYKELQEKMQLGLKEATAELNRINYTLLSLCDDAAALENINAEPDLKPFSDAQKSKNSINSSLLIFGLIAAIGTAIILGIFFWGSKNDEKPKETEILPLPLPTPDHVTPSVKSDLDTWIAIPNSVNVSDKNFGNLKVDVLNMKTTDKDAETKIITLELKLNCLSSSTGACLLSYLEFRLLLPNGNKDAPKDDIYFANNPKDGKSVNNQVSFIVPKSTKQASFQIYYRNKMDNTLKTIQLNSPN